MVPRFISNYFFASRATCSAMASFLLQLCLLILVLGGLTVLRRDAIVLVLGPLRRMLKIVARCKCVENVRSVFSIKHLITLGFFVHVQTPRILWRTPRRRKRETLIRMTSLTLNVLPRKTSSETLRREHSSLPLQKLLTSFESVGELQVLILFRPIWRHKKALLLECCK